MTDATKLADLIDAHFETLASVVHGADQVRLAVPRADGLALGDGTIRATVAHVCDVYDRLAAFATASHAGGAGDPQSEAHGPGRHHGDGGTAASATRDALLYRVVQSRATMAALLLDADLETVPVEGSFRFCDGRRTLLEVVEAVTRHQQHHVDAVRASPV